MTDTIEVANGHTPIVQYLHIRRPVIGYAMRGMYMPEPCSHGGVTVAYEKVAGGLDIAFSRCDPRDPYNKNLGRAIAANRLSDGDSITVQLLEGESETDVIRELIYHLKENRRNLKPAIKFDGRPNK